MIWQDIFRRRLDRFELIEALMNRKIEAEERGWLGELEGIEIARTPPGTNSYRW